MACETEQALQTDPVLKGIIEQLKIEQPESRSSIVQTSTTRADFESMMHPEFCEIGASGRCYSQKLLLAELEGRHQQAP